MGKQESPQLIERKTQGDTDDQETSRASNKLEMLHFGLWFRVMHIQ